MCRYRYHRNLCAHRLIEGRECIGEESCRLGSLGRRGFTVADECHMEKWQGLYCPRYQRFYCSGRENCETMESYMSHFVDFRESRGRI
ncbi:MAG TPA: hypothetical protein VMW26_06010 [Methanomassiliicoccales archaeon]|nr:hypothetical protein [Methanomassiliicoccales archaeon]